MEDVIDRLHMAKGIGSLAIRETFLAKRHEAQRQRIAKKDSETREKPRFLHTKERASVSGWCDPEEALHGLGTTGKAGNAAFRGMEGRPKPMSENRRQIRSKRQWQAKVSGDAQEELGLESEEKEDTVLSPHGHVPTISLDWTPNQAMTKVKGRSSLVLSNGTVSQSKRSQRGDFDVDGGANYEDANYEDADDEWDSEEEEDAKMVQREPPSEEEVLHKFKGNLLKLAVYNASRENLIKRIIEENWLRYEEAVGL
ncbi:hypothetical protein IMY05_C4934000100 [Salix suchowensis]|nr:hypothetical protein IMY05_C4934000100 [Salix suchowensis]